MHRTCLLANLLLFMHVVNIDVFETIAICSRYGNHNRTSIRLKREIWSGVRDRVVAMFANVSSKNRWFDSEYGQTLFYSLFPLRHFFNPSVLYPIIKTRSERFIKLLVKTAIGIYTQKPTHLYIHFFQCMEYPHGADYSEV